MNTNEDRFTAEQIMEVERRTRNAAHSHEYSGTVQQAKRYRETASILRQAASDTARIAELTAEAAMLREQNDALSRISARAHTVLNDTPRACFSMYTKNMRETRSFGDQCDEIVDMVIAMNGLARNALKDG